MSGHPQPATAQGQSHDRGGERECSKGGGRVKLYVHAVTDEQASLLADTANARPLEEVRKKSGATVELDSNPSPVPGMKIVIIRGLPSQIEMAVNLISRTIGSKDPLADQAQTFWLQWVEAAFPDLDSRAYFLPPVYFNRVPMSRETVAGQEVLVLEPAPGQAGQSNQSARNTSISQPPLVSDSDVRYDAAIQRVLCCLERLCEQSKEVMVGMSQLSFGQYLGEPCYAAAAAQLPLPSNLPPAVSRNWKQGDFEVLLIHRHYGFIVCEIKVLGDKTETLNKTQQDLDNTIRKKTKDAVSQLDKAEAMLSHLVSDVRPGLPVTKTIAFPNLTTRQLQQAISGDIQLTQDLCRCLGTSDPADITGLCLCCDQLSDPETPCDVSSHVLRELGHWWQRRVAGARPDSHMTPVVYKSLVARFCGPATTVSVPCTCPPRVSVKTLGQAVWWTGQCYTAVITLFPEQVHLLHTAPPTLFVTGPPGTGKTVVLLLMAIQWLLGGHHVYVVSTYNWSLAASIMLYHLLLQTVNTQQSAGVSPGQPHLLEYDFDDDRNVKMAVKDLSQAANGGSLYVIADEAGPDWILRHFKTFCDKLLKQVPCLHLWAASCFFRDAVSDGWQVAHLTRPLRSPPAVVREVEQDRYIAEHHEVMKYSERGVPDHTDGPPVTRLYHRGEGHAGNKSVDCVTCGREVASFLHSLRVGVTENVPTTSTTPCLHWNDVLVLSLVNLSENAGVVKGLQEAGIEVRVMKDDDIDDVATARSDVVWATRGHRVRGLERKVVVCLKDVDVNTDSQLHFMSRCTSQLVIVSPYD